MKDALKEYRISFSGLAPGVHTFEYHVGQEFRLPVQGTDHRVVKQGEGTSLDDDIILLPMGETELNLGQYIYEMIVLNIPQKRYHPDYLSGKLAAPKASSSPEPTEQTVDPRWEKLKDIKS